MLLFYPIDICLAFLPITYKAVMWFHDSETVPRRFLITGVLKTFAKIIEKRLCWSLFLNKGGGLWPETLLKRILRHGCFPVNFAKFLRTPSVTHPVTACDYCMVQVLNYIWCKYFI